MAKPYYVVEAAGQPVRFIPAAKLTEGSRRNVHCPVCGGYKWNVLYIEGLGEVLACHNEPTYLRLVGDSDGTTEETWQGKHPYYDSLQQV